MTSCRIAWVFPGFGVGGAQVRFATIANAMGEACSHVVLSLNGDCACREKLSPGLQVEFPDPGHRGGQMLPAILQARRVLRAVRPDLVVTSNWGAIEWAMGAKLSGLRHVHTEDGFGPEERGGQLPRRVLTRRLVLRGSAVILPSRNLLRIATDVWRLPPRNLHYIPNGIDLARFAGAAPAVLPPGEGRVIGTVAALRPEKNIARLIRAFAAVRDALPLRLVIVGDGPEMAMLKNLARALGVAGDVHFAGHSACAESWLAAFDLFALSSDTEQMPLSLLEAMAAGLPALCTDVGDVRAMLAERNRAFVTAIDDAAFAAGLREILTADWAEMGADNRRRAEREFSLEGMVAGHARVLRIGRQEVLF